MRVFNKSINPLLLIAVSVITTGCSENPKEPLSAYENNSSTPENEGYVYHSPYYRNLPNKSNDKAATGQHDTVWDRLLALYSLPDIDNERVDKELEWYLDHPDYIERIQKRAEPYLHLILNEIEAKNIPGELALLPVVESAFIPDAYSPADASGLWQFIPSTGNDFGLQQNEWYDGRRDVYASTKAATTFLKNLGDSFDGDWFLALASYNYGKGNVIKSIARNEEQSLPTDYWSLRLPKETADYVPRLLAIAKLFANAEEYNIPLRHIPDKPYFEVVNIESPLDLRKAAQLAETPLDKFLKLNPGFSGTMTAPQGPHRLLVPVEKAQSFKTKLAQLPYEERFDLQRYNEERLAQLAVYEEKKAAKQQREEEKAAERNNRVITTAADEERKTLKSSRHDGAKIIAKVKARVKEKQMLAQHKVKSGESLSAIASRNHTTVKALVQANHLKDSDEVATGVTLHIPTGKQAHSNTVDSSQVYSVKKGDTVRELAAKFGASQRQIAQWKKTGIKAGQKLVINAPAKTVDKPLKVAMATTAKSTKAHVNSYSVKHTTASINKTASKIKVSAADVRKANTHLTKGARTGQKLRVAANG
jgi:membrane-bound lytic murein transglycosylase D